MVKKKKGITLVSLIITIVIMLILAAVALSLIIGKNGLFNKAKESVTIYEKSRIQEKLQLAATNGYTGEAEKEITEEDVADTMQEEIPDIEWVYKDSLAGHYSGYDFTVIDRVVVMDVLQKSTKSLNFMENGAGTYVYDEMQNPKFFWSYKNNIKSITFTIDNDLSKYNSNAVNSNIPWDISTKENNEILAYLEPIDGDTSNYNLYIVSDKVIDCPENSKGLFAFFNNVSAINNFNCLNTSHVTDMSYMFYKTGDYITSFNLGDNFDTSLVADMNNMFNYFGFNQMSNFSLGLNFDTSNVENMSYMFAYTGHEKMSILDLGGKFDTLNVKNMSYMFYQCGQWSLSSIILGSNFNTSNVTNMEGMFHGFGANNLADFSLGDNFYTSKVTNMHNMFSTCGEYNVTNFSLGEHFDTSNVIYMDGMFLNFGRNGLESLDLGDNFYTSKVTDFSYMFAGCGSYKLQSLSLGNHFDTSNAKDTMEEMFAECGRDSMTNLDLGPLFVIPDVVTDRTMEFYKATKIGGNIDCLESQNDIITELLNSSKKTVTSKYHD